MCACGTVQCVLLTFRHTNLCVRTGFCLCIRKPIWLKEQSTQNRNFVHFPITASQDPFDIFSSGAIRGFQFNNNTQSKGTIFIYHFWQEKNKTKLQFPYCFCCVIQALAPQLKQTRIVLADLTCTHEAVVGILAENMALNSQIELRCTLDN